jgi:hypothetical protein
MKLKERIITKKKVDPEDPESIEVLEDVLESLDLTRDVVEVNNELRPYKVLGFAASSALTISLITTLLSYYGILFSLYVSSNPVLRSIVAYA